MDVCMNMLCTDMYDMMQMHMRARMIERLTVEEVDK